MSKNRVKTRAKSAELAGSAPGLQYPARNFDDGESRVESEAAAASQPSVPSLAAIKDRSYGQMHTATGPATAWLRRGHVRASISFPMKVAVSRRQVPVPPLPWRRRRADLP